jgi:hypothetical protein
MPTNEQLDSYFEKLFASGKYSPAFYGVYFKETGNEKDKAGARRGHNVGPMQLDLRYPKAFGVDPLDPYQNIKGGLDYLVKLYDKFGDEKKAIAAYNWGETNLRSHIRKYGDDWESKLPKSVQRYIFDVHVRNPEFDKAGLLGQQEMETWGDLMPRSADQYIKSLSTQDLP